MSLLTLARKTRHSEIEVLENSRNHLESMNTFRIAYPETMAYAISQGHMLNFLGLPYTRPHEAQ